MKRLARHLFTLCAALSLLLCVAVCVLWVWSDSRLFRLTLTHDEGRGVSRWVELLDGGFQYAETDHPSLRLGRPGWGTMECDGASHVRQTRWGFGTRTHLFLGAAPMRRATFWRAPVWPLVLLIAVASVPSLLTLLRRRRSWRLTRGGFCPSCSYGLRASPERCPECGAEPEAPRPPHSPPMQPTEPAGRLLHH